MPPFSILAFALSAVTGIVLGSLWYGPLFGRTWMKTIGVDLATMSEEERKKGMRSMPKNVLVSVVCTLLIAYSLFAGLTFGDAYLHTSGIFANLMGAFWYWLGFTAAPLLIVTTWEGKPFKNFLVHAAYYFILIEILATLYTYVR